MLPLWRVPLLVDRLSPVTHPLSGGYDCGRGVTLRGPDQLVAERPGLGDEVGVGARSAAPVPMTVSGHRTRFCGDPFPSVNPDELNGP